MKLVFAFCAALVSIGCVSVGAQPRGGDRFVLFENNAPRPPRAIPHVRAHQAALVPVPRKARSSTLSSLSVQGL